MKFVLYRDFTAGHADSYAYDVMEAKTLEDAIEEADRIWRREENTLYLIRIMRTESRSWKEEGWRVQNIRAILCKRSAKGGWHKNTEANSEGEHVRKLYTQKDMTFVY